MLNVFTIINATLSLCEILELTTRGEIRLFLLEFYSRKFAVIGKARGDWTTPEHNLRCGGLSIIVWSKHLVVTNRLYTI